MTKNNLFLDTETTGIEVLKTVCKVAIKLGRIFTEFLNRRFYDREVYEHYQHY